MSSKVAFTQSPTEVTALIRRVQKALLEGRQLSLINEAYVWAPRQGDLPDLNVNEEHTYQAVEAGVFRAMEWQRGGEKGKKWVRLCALDALDDVLEPSLRRLSEDERAAFSADLTFQVMMGQESEVRSRRRQAPGR